MYLRFLGAMAILLCGALGIMAARPEAHAPYYVADEISVDGPALFYGIEADMRTELWSVHCTQPLRGCVARASGLVLRLDAQGRPWLITVAPPQARISIRSDDTTRHAPRLLRTPMAVPTIAALSDREGAVIIETPGALPVHIRTTGLVQVVDYLAWVNGNTARTLRDARLWPRGGKIRIQDMNPDVLERYEMMHRRARET